MNQMAVGRPGVTDNYEKIGIIINFEAQKRENINICRSQICPFLEISKVGILHTIRTGKLK